MKSLLAARKEFPVIKFDRTATFTNALGRQTYRYASLGAIQVAVDPILAQHDLMWMATVDDEKLTVSIVNALGQVEASSACQLKDKSDVREWGADKTYKTRHLLTGLLGINTEEDTDGMDQQEDKKKPQIPDETVKALTKRQEEGETIDLAPFDAKYTIPDAVRAMFTMRAAAPKAEPEQEQQVKAKITPGQLKTLKTRITQDPKYDYTIYKDKYEITQEQITELEACRK